MGALHAIMWVIVIILILIICIKLRFAEKIASGGGEIGHDAGDALHWHAKKVLNHGHIKRGKGGGRGSGKKTEWHKYKSWEEMREDEGATEEYFKARERLLKNPNLDWGEVMEAMKPKLAEKREYIGIANLKEDGKTLYIEKCEAADGEGGEINFASIPSKTVARYADMPGLIIFHTHPNDERASPLPSSNDLATAIYLGATARFAASAVISKYGVITHGLDWDGYNAINSAKDWKLATLNMCYDVVAGHESIRSWKRFTLDEYFEFYPKYKLFAFVYPTGEYIGDNREKKWEWDIEGKCDYQLIQRHLNDINRHLNRKTGDETLDVEKIELD